MSHTIATPFGTLTPAEALFALYNNYPSRPENPISPFTPAGLISMVRGGVPMTMEEAEARIAQGLYVDYLHGKPIKTDFSREELDFWLYDRDAGQGAGLRAIELYINSRSRAQEKSS